MKWLFFVVVTGVTDGVMSSFKPASSAKLYASPEDVKTVGFRSRSLPGHGTRSQVVTELDVQLE